MWGLQRCKLATLPSAKVYRIIAGEVRHGVLDQPVAGASVFAIGEPDDGFVARLGFSGTTQVSFDPQSRGGFRRSGVQHPPVPKGNYAVGAQALDGFPVAPPASVCRQRRAIRRDYRDLRAAELQRGVL